MSSVLRIFLQALNLTLFMGLVGYFSIYPQFKHLDDDQAMITLAVVTLILSWSEAGFV